MKQKTLIKLSKRNFRKGPYALPNKSNKTDGTKSTLNNSQSLNNNNFPETLFDNSFLDSFNIKNLSLSQAFVIKNQNIPIESFNKKISSIMEHYKYDSMEERNDDNTNDVIKLLPKIQREKYKKQKEEIRSIFNKTKLSKSQSSHFFNSNHNVSETYNQVRFDFIKEQFKNPIQAYHLIQKNKVIYEGMVQNFENFEKNTYRENFKKLGPLVLINYRNEQNKGYKQPPKIKISKKIPKIVDTSWFNPNMQPSNNEDNNKNKNRNNSETKDKKITNLTSNKIDLFDLNNNKILFSSNISSIQLEVKFIYSSRLFPESREQFVFAQEANDVLLCGGFVSNKSNVMWKFIPSSLKWKRVDLGTLNPEARYGHSGVMHNGKLIIFGGKYINLPILGDVDVFNLDTKIWSTPPLTSYSKLKLRRNHIAISVGNQMFIHGGIDEEGNYLSDCYLLNYNPFKWINVSISEDTPSPVLAYHKCCLVLPEDIRINPRLSIYRIPDIGTKRGISNNIREKGIYFFGGKQSENSPPVDDLYILRIGRRPLEWAKMRTKGIGPTARYSTSINYYEEGNSIIVHGGRNDKSSDNFALNDTYILELYNLNWLRVEYYFELENMRMPYRCSHESIIYGHLLIIFGGMNSDNFLGSELCVIELDSNKRITNKQHHRQTKVNIIANTNRLKHSNKFL